jgi:hypothetical protein
MGSDTSLLHLFAFRRSERGPDAYGGVDESVCRDDSMCCVGGSGDGGEDSKSMSTRTAFMPNVKAKDYLSKDLRCS